MKGLALAQAGQAVQRLPLVQCGAAVYTYQELLVLFLLLLQLTVTACRCAVLGLPYFHLSEQL